MTRYIDADELLNKLPEDLPYKASVKRVLMQAPKAEVVPRAEAEELKREYESLAKTVNEASELIRKLRSKVEKSKTEVAREIFWDVWSYLNEAYKENRISYVSFIHSTHWFAELKKKYTEDHG